MRLLHGDCREVMRELPENSVDAIVTDPPYGLEFMGRDWDAPWKAGVGLGSHEAAFNDVEMADGAKRLPRPNYLGANTNPTCRNCGGLRRGKEGKKSQQPCRCDAPIFDNLIVPRQRAFQEWSESWAREAYRVLKPGGHLLAFGGSRTYHRLACAVEDAGFEIRDQLQWLYGSGFPKSHDVSKAMDKRRQDDVRPVCHFLRSAMESAGLTAPAIAERFGFHSRMVDHWAARDTDSQPSVPTWEQWHALKDLLNFSDEMDAEVWRLNGRKGQPGEAWHEREVVGQRDVPIGHAFAGPTYGGDSSSVTINETTAATDLARQWDGWGTALKPAHEPIVLARKPLIGTVAANVSEWGTGALHIAATRIGGNLDEMRGRSGVAADGNRIYGEGVRNPTDDIWEPAPLGRWPANVLLDEDAAALLDAQSGERAPGRRGVGRGPSDGIYSDGLNSPRSEPMYGDTGGASRFFLNVAPDDQNLIYNRETCILSTCISADPSHPDQTDITSPQKATFEAPLTDASALSIPLSGSEQTALFLTDTKSTTLTGTSRTPTSPTSNYSHGEITSDCTPAANGATASGGSPVASVASSSRSTPNTGTSAERDIHSTGAVAPAISDESLPINNGGATRFLYQAKASRAERNAGLGGPGGVHANMHPT
jgi:hypothetical protein